MSYNVHKRKASDRSRPVEMRASNARSLCVIISHRHAVRRETVITRVHELTGVDLHTVRCDEDLSEAIQCLDALRERFPEVTDPADLDRADGRDM